MEKEAEARQLEAGRVSAVLAHLPASPLSWVKNEDWVKGGEVLLSVSPVAEEAIVFIHGWGGDAVGTWENFRAGIHALPEMSMADALFWAYPSKTHQVAYSAGVLRQFLSDLIDAPVRSILDPSCPQDLALRGDGFRYQRITLCAHSMGAVIARRAMIDLDREGGLGDPPPVIRLLLFAPAHKGSNLPLMIRSGFGLGWVPGATLVANALRLHYSSLEGLAKGGQTLRELEEHSRCLRLKLERGGKNTAHLRAQVLHAQNDRVVEQDSFDDDPPFTPVMKQTHRSICKPNDSYLQPIEALRRAL
jgi:pimeloyl-ACP methyl ester carboxylesterase